MASRLEASLAEELDRLESAGLRRRLEPSSPGRVDFASNDTLGLSRDPRLIEAARAAVAEHGVGGRASRLLGGGAPVHAAAERAVAEWLGAEAALLFPSGYQANLGLVSALARRGDALFSDARNHASLVDAARLSRARVHVHAHLDVEELARALSRARGARRRLVLTEGVFSIDGDRAPLAALAELCAVHDAWLVVDEAHAAGLLGPAGAGAWADVERDLAPELRERLAARVVTGGKALGAGGALVVGSRVLALQLVNRARSFLYTTAPSPALAGALVAAVGAARGMDREREQVLGLARELARRLSAPEPGAAIVPCVLGGPMAATEAAKRLQEAGFDVGAVRPPTVPAGEEGLRLVCHATNTMAEVDDLARTLLGGDGPLLPVPAARPAAPAPPRRALFVVGTDTGVGKTVVGALLLRAARRLGPAVYWKPVQTGPESDTETVRRLAQAKPHEVLGPAWSLALAASPHEAAAHEGREIDPRRLEEGLAALRRTLPEARLVVELAGGLLVPYRLAGAGRPQATQGDWLERAGQDLVLVARTAVGTLNHTLLTLEALRARHLEPRALFLVGEPHAANEAALRELSGIPLVLHVPPLRPVSPEALDEWLEAHELGELLGEPEAAP